MGVAHPRVELCSSLFILTMAEMLSTLLPPPPPPCVPHTGSLKDEHRLRLVTLFDWLVDPCIGFIRRNCRELVSGRHCMPWCTTPLLLGCEDATSCSWELVLNKK